MSMAVPSLETVPHLLTTSLSCSVAVLPAGLFWLFLKLQLPFSYLEVRSLAPGSQIDGEQGSLFIPLSSPYRPLPLPSFSSAVLVSFLQPCPTISLISMFSVKLTSHGVGVGPRRRHLYPLMSNYSSASRTQRRPQATAWGTGTSSGSLPSPSRYSPQIRLNGTRHILCLTKL